ncbi:HNH endonuclease [bacterium]|nr:HNH endonuclease [bacterium]
MGEHHSIEARLIDHLQKAERIKLPQHRVHTSLFRYVVDELGYSESVAYNLITVARKAREIPAMKEEIRKGNLSVSKLRKICPVINKENQRKWIEDAKTNNTRELEMKVASEKTDHVKRASLKAVARDTLRLSLDISSESRDKLERLKDVLCSKKGRDCPLQEVLDFALETAIEKHDPVCKAKRANKRRQKKAESVRAQTSSSTCDEKSSQQTKHSARGACPVTGESKELEMGKAGVEKLSRSVRNKRKPIPASVLHEVNQRDRGQCTFKDKQGRKCTQRRWLHTHHVIPVSEGGDNQPSNLRNLCSNHHRIIHERLEKNIHHPLP